MSSTHLSKANLHESAASLRPSAAAQAQGNDDDSLDLPDDVEQKCNQAFSAFDRDGSDDIDIEELRIVLTMMGIKVTESKLQRMIRLKMF